MTVINCCTTSNPCFNGGTCLPPLPSSKKRFRCQCPDGFEGEHCDVCNPGYGGPHCDKPIRSCRGYDNGSRISGNYTMLDVNNNTFQVFCDFDKNATITWTLIQSYSLHNNEIFKSSSFNEDSPHNQNNPSWSRYRLSKSRMESIQQDSTKWRVTCRYETDGVLYTDYLRALNTELNILTFKDKIKKCVEVEYINVRGYNCTHCTAHFKQNQFHILHFVSKDFNCAFNPPESASCNSKKRAEDSFGYYNCKNTKHRCSSSNNATTETWFGGKWN